MKLKVDGCNKHGEINKMHIPTVLHGYIIQAFRLPFTAHHSPTVGRSQQLRMRNNGKSTIPEDSDKKHYYYGYNIQRQLTYSGPHIFIPGLNGFFYRPGYGSASSLGND